MANYNSIDLRTKPNRSGGIANSSAFFGTLTPSANVVTGDILRFCIIPAGTIIFRTTVVNASLGTTVPGDIELAPVDGSTKTVFSAAFAFPTANANGSVINKKPVRVLKDSYLQVTLGTVSAGAATELSVIAEGEVFGAA